MNDSSYNQNSSFSFLGLLNLQDFTPSVQSPSSLQQDDLNYSNLINQIGSFNQQDVRALDPDSVSNHLYQNPVFFLSATELDTFISANGTSNHQLLDEFDNSKPIATSNSSALPAHSEFELVPWAKRDEENPFRLSKEALPGSKVHQLQDVAVSTSKDKEKNNKQLFICKQCKPQRYFKTNNSFRSHKSSTHCPLEKRTCEICQRSFKSKNSLFSHKKTHNEKTVKCPEKGCTSTFHFTHDLYRHQRSIHKVEPVFNHNR